MTDRSGSGTGRYSHRTMAAALLPVLALTVAGCGSGYTGPGIPDPWVTDPKAGDPAAILAAWRSFPADADPRPPVLTGPTVLDPQGGFPAEGAKEAYLIGRFELATRLPAAPAASDGYPVVSAKAAFEQLQATYPDATSKGGRSVPTLRISTAVLGQASFETDRGPRRLPAWCFGLEQFASPIWVLAIDPRHLWTAKPTSATDLDFRATPDPDGRTLRLSFVGGPDEPTACGVTYTASAVESATAVVIRLASKPQRPLRGEAMCSGVGYPRTVPLGLAAPLAGRVLLSPYGVPLPESAS